jgi:hypothetical protein
VLYTSFSISNANVACVFPRVLLNRVPGTEKFENPWSGLLYKPERRVRVIACQWLVLRMRREACLLRKRTVALLNILQKNVLVCGKDRTLSFGDRSNS